MPVLTYSFCVTLLFNCSIILHVCALAAEAIRDRDPAKGIVHSHIMHGDPQPGCPGFFKLDAKYNIYWRMNDLKKDQSDIHAVKKEHAASTVPLTTWDTKLTHLVWHMRWGRSGLQPVRPTIVFKASVTLKPGKVMELVHDD